MSNQWKTANCKASVENVVYAVCINLSRHAPAAPGGPTVHPPVFIIHRKGKGPDGCAGSHPGPQTVKNWFFPRRALPVATRDGVTLDSRFPADNRVRVVPGLREDPGLPGRWMCRDPQRLLQLACQTPARESRCLSDES